MEAQLERPEPIGDDLLRRLNPRLEGPQLARRRVRLQLLRATAEELVDRLSRRLANDVPERDLHRPRPPHEERHRAQVRHVLFHRERVLAHQKQPRHLPPNRHSARPDADDSLVRMNFHHVDAGSGRRYRLPRRVERLRHRVFEEAYLDGGDFHGRAPLERMDCQRIL